ncbi:GntR family transcriptional regulator [Streptomyces tsukubensis]|uniref:GntR family transcriptional regulator n=1 Tax=Streptomyces tsukubensis TaxID=83656 RepID=A0A1V4ADU5_9ACTN|nr:GntR family transcriptional regulator [Streptomyces tsukubensis]OON82180.1 GntR family transcriptional regulator [Streptomyces tsukubensis]QFR92668.1 UTRA domain-containing protein [Streptomyces tsukubensis]
MPGQVHKHHRVAKVLAEEIRAGVHADGSRLPGEHALRERFGVSRTTVRQALGVLGEQGLIQTHAGIGSLVTFDGRALDQRLGWTKALDDQGTRLTADILRFERITDPELAEELGTADDGFIALDRVRRLPDGVGVSLERSRVPAVPALADLPERGLVEGSLNRTLLAAGRVSESSEAWLSVTGLDAADAALIGRPADAPFIRLAQVFRDADSEVVEHVTSLLDPSRFQLHVQTGRGGPS